MRRLLKLGLPLLFWSGYAAVQHFFHDAAGFALADLGVVPVAVTAWCWGSWAGAATGLAAFGLTAGPVTPTQPLEWLKSLQRDLPHGAVTVVLGAVFGHFGAVQRQLTAHKRLNREAQFDALTGLLNRTAFEHKLARSIEDAAATRGVLAVLFVDLDRFKLVNDTYGHETGDELLKTVAKCLTSTVRDNDLVARLGGDEFIIALRNLKESESAAFVAAKLVERLNTPFEVAGKVLFISASVGISLYPNDGADVETLTRNADTAMYAGKAAGKNRYSFSTQAVQRRQSRRLTLERQLHHALADNQLELHYQPQVDLRTSRLTGLEALLRWHNPELGDIAPAEFVPLAEEGGTILPIGQWLLREVCHQGVAWQRVGYAPVKLGVNVSVLQFNQPDFVATVAKALHDSGLAPHLLELEITESLLMQDLGRAAQTLRKLQRLGVETVLDDFGTGHSSLAYLQQLPIRSLKIDRSFVSALTTTPWLHPEGTSSTGNNTVIIEAICALAHNLDKSVVAEGVETERQRAYLAQLNCDFAQGFLFSKPLLAREVERLLVRTSPKPGPRHAVPRNRVPGSAVPGSAPKIRPEPGGSFEGLVLGD